MSKEIPIPKYPKRIGPESGAFFGIWNLGFHWTLGFGIWTFGLTGIISAEPVSTPAATPAPAELKPAAPPPPIPIELQPYRVRVSVAFADDPSLPPRFRNDLLAELTTWIERTYSEMWQATVEENRWLAPADSDGLSRLTWPRVETLLADQELDKAFLLCVSVQGGALRLSGREWDRLTQQLSVRQDRLVGDRRAAANESGVILRDLFHPIVMIDGADARTAKVRVRAGEFPPGDPSAEQLPVGAFFQPLFRYYNKQRELQQIQTVPWTYLSVDSSDRSVGQCSIHTGLRVALGKNSKRSESWAVGIRPTFPETRVRLTPHNNPKKPLTGYNVTVFDRRMVLPAAVPEVSGQKSEVSQEGKSKKSEAVQFAAGAQPAADGQAAETKPPPAPPQPVAQFDKLVELVTDRRGRVTVPADPSKPLIWLYVSSGGNTLGRFPYIPGTTAATTAELPDDTLRLQLESRLELLRAELIDSVARRALLFARAKGAAKGDDATRFNEALKELDRQPNAKYFHTILDSVKVATAKQAQDRKDKGLERKIDKLAKEAAELIERHLSDDRVKEQRDDLVEIRRGDQDVIAPENDKPRAIVPTRKPPVQKP